MRAGAARGAGVSIRTQARARWAQDAGGRGDLSATHSQQSRSSWQIPVLAGMGYRVWAVNQRGYGRTTRPTQVADYALPHLVDDVTALINAARAKNVVLIGHDWGAMVAWCFAAQQRHPLDRLVIMNDPHPLCFRAALKHWRQVRKSWYVAFSSCRYCRNEC